MQVLYRINRTGTTVLVVTHDREMVDKMRRRVIALDSGRVVRDQAAGTYTPDDESTREFARRVREEMGLDDQGPRY
jgi:cell division transport system ATP-binding protein